MRTRPTALAAFLIVAGCGNDAKIVPAPPMKEMATTPPSDAAPGLKTDGGGGGGENTHGPKRADADKKIAEIRANPGFSDELKKQLIDEVERTYKEAQSSPSKR